MIRIMFLVNINRSKKLPIYEQIEQFLYHRKDYITTREHVVWIRRFVKVTGVTTAEKITSEDIQSFTNALSDTQTNYTRLRAAAAIRIFMDFVRSHGILESDTDMKKRKPGRPRNEELRKLARKYEKKGLSMSKIGEKIGKAKSTVYQYLTT
jgi:hypothetical protein